MPTFHSYQLKKTGENSNCLRSCGRKVFAQYISLNDEIVLWMFSNLILTSFLEKEEMKMALILGMKMALMLNRMWIDSVNILELKNLHWRKVKALVDWEIEPSSHGVSVAGNMYWVLTGETKRETGSLVYPDRPLHHLLRLRNSRKKEHEDAEQNRTRDYSHVNPYA
ncbi:hypothetical protein F2Q68_00045522 [Brassica cretica]|uniref:Uncharacterized protein n=1 Tax=Brassica cretica TaxID=69181 RepID=A0A8S9LK26_BRACR|nr:hypothetical protein F2Q68_00045522 [Brassica cretica]